MPAPKEKQRPCGPAPAPTRRTHWRLLWVLATPLIGILLLPYLLVPLYRVIDPVSTLMMWRWASGSRVERTFLRLARMASPLPLTVVAAEDARFCRHRGIDWQEIREQIEE